MAERQRGKKGTFRHQYHNKVLSTKAKFLRGIFGHSTSPSVTHRPKHNEDTVQIFSCDMQLITNGFLANEQYHSHLPYKPYCWKKGEEQTGRGGTSMHLEGSERHPPSSPTSLTKVAGHNTVQAMLENISLQSCSSDNMHKHAINSFCFNRPDNNNCTQAIAHT